MLSILLGSSLETVDHTRVVPAASMLRGVGGSLWQQTRCETRWGGAVMKCVHVLCHEQRLCVEVLHFPL
jgi:hypothetical protein